jgi:hypothetical protein
MPSIIKGFVSKTPIRIAILSRTLTPTLNKAIIVIKKTSQAKPKDLIIIIINRTLIKGL